MGFGMSNRDGEKLVSTIVIYSCPKCAYYSFDARGTMCSKGIEKDDALPTLEADLADCGIYSEDGNLGYIDRVMAQYEEKYGDRILPCGKDAPYREKVKKEVVVEALEQAVPPVHTEDESSPKTKKWWKN